MSKLQVKIDGEWKDLSKVEEVKINGKSFENYEGFTLDERTYVKEPTRSSVTIIANIVDTSEFVLPKCFIEDKEIQKEYTTNIDIISDATFAFISNAIITLLFNAKHFHGVDKEDKFYYEWNYETLERNVPLPHDDRPCYEKGRVTLRYTIVRAESKGEVFDRNFKKLTSGEFGNPEKFETMLAYWKAQTLAGYPLAEENVRYFEEMVRKNERK